MSNLLVIIKKELKDIFRDKKTIIFSLLLPIIIYPAMFALMDSSEKDTQKKIEEGIKIGIVDKGQSEIGKVIKADKRYKVSDTENLDEALKSGDISVIVEIPENFDSKINEEQSTGLKLVYDETSSTSSTSVNVVRNYLNEYYNEIVTARIEKRGLDKSIITPFAIETLSNSNKKQEDVNELGNVMMSMLPTLIVIFIFTPTIAVAADLGAGEKERGTFEPLLTTSAKRGTILWGKLISIAIVSGITLMVTMAAMVVSLNMFFDNAAKSMNLSGASAALIILFSILLLVAIVAVELSVSIYSRSMKEANSYLGGLTFVIFILTYLPMMMDVKAINPNYFHIPITNVVCVMKEFIVGIYNLQHILTVAAWFVVYVAVSLLFARRMFNKEEVIFRA
jgi:sodium transport system permease protein